MNCFPPIELFGQKKIADLFEGPLGTKMHRSRIIETAITGEENPWSSGYFWLVLGRVSEFSETLQLLF